MLQKDGSIVLQDFYKGSAVSQYIGYGGFVGCNIFDEPGIVKLNNKLALGSSTNVDNLPLYFAHDGTNDWCQCDDGDVHKETTSWTVIAGNTSATGVGLIYYKDYIISFEANYINAYGPISSSPSWTNAGFGGDAMPASTKGRQPIIAAKNGKLYFSGGRYVLSLVEVSGQTLAPGTPGTYTIKNTTSSYEVALPPDYEIVNMTEMDEFLIISANNAKLNKSGIFYWDMTSSLINYYILTGTNDIKTHISVNGLTYFIAGKECRIYATNGKVFGELGQLPSSLMDLDVSATYEGVYPSIHPTSIMYFNGRIYFGTYSSNLYGVKVGLWSFMPNGFNQVSVNLEHIMASGDVNGSGKAFGALFPFSDTQFWAGTNAGVEYLDTTNLMTSYSAYFLSPYYNVGTVNNPKTYKGIEVDLARPISTNMGIKIYYRTSIGDTWQSGSGTNNTAHITIDTANQQQYYGKAIPNIKDIQFKIALTGGTLQPKLKRIIIA